jgi:hypothetical protein
MDERKKQLYSSTKGMVIHRVRLSSRLQHALPFTPLFLTLAAATRPSFELNVCACICQRSSWLTPKQLQLQTKSCRRLVLAWKRWRRCKHPCQKKGCKYISLSLSWASCCLGRPHEVSAWKFHDHERPKIQWADAVFNSCPL